MAQEEEVVGVEAKSGAYLLDLVDEAVDLPEVGVVGLIAVERSELIVVVVLDARRWKEAVAGLEVLMGRGGTTVQEEQLRGRVVADALRPDVEVALRRRHRDHPDAAAEDVVASCVVEIRRSVHWYSYGEAGISGARGGLVIDSRSAPDAA